MELTTTAIIIGSSGGAVLLGGAFVGGWYTGKKVTLSRQQRMLGKGIKANDAIKKYNASYKKMRDLEKSEKSSSVEVHDSPN